MESERRSSVGRAVLKLLIWLKASELCAAVFVLRGGNGAIYADGRR